MLERHICFTNDSDDLTTLTKRFIEIWNMTDLHDSSKQNERNRLNSINKSTHTNTRTNTRAHTLWTHTIERPSLRSQMRFAFANSVWCLSMYRTVKVRQNDVDATLAYSAWLHSSPFFCQTANTTSCIKLLYYITFWDILNCDGRFRCRMLEKPSFLAEKRSKMWFLNIKFSRLRNFDEFLDFY